MYTIDRSNKGLGNHHHSHSLRERQELENVFYTEWFKTTDNPLPPTPIIDVLIITHQDKDMIAMAAQRLANDWYPPR